MGKCQARENRRMQSRTLLIAVNEITLTRVLCKGTNVLKVKNALTVQVAARSKA
jgi:hypothetical protein